MDDKTRNAIVLNKFLILEPVLNGGVPNDEDVMYGPDIKIDRKKFQPYLHIFIDTKY